MNNHNSNSLTAANKAPVIITFSSKLFGPQNLKVCTFPSVPFYIEIVVVFSLCGGRQKGPSGPNRVDVSDHCNWGWELIEVPQMTCFFRVRDGG